jgi:uncharacterized membrane protein
MRRRWKHAAPSGAATKTLVQAWEARVMSEAVTVFSGPTPYINRVPVDRPWTWLAKGWADLRQAPVVSMAFGFALALFGFVLLGGLWMLDLFYLVLPLSAGFMLMGPFLAIGLYEVSRRLAANEPVTLFGTAQALRRNLSQFLLIAIALMIFLLAWIRIATLIFALFFSHTPPGFENFMVEVFFSTESIPFVLTGIITGGILAAAVFAISAVSIPMLLDRPDANVAAAIVTSVNAVRINALPMAVWGALIVLFTAAGLVVVYVGLIVAMPLIGHATWHAYRDVIEFKDTAPQTEGEVASAQTA